ncbi:MAG: glycosyltransferase family 2 protein [Elusimicrobia bacterium]|nr:glycosyltransferase family 2 protein [Elusimicrobiota bacterium]
MTEHSLKLSVVIPAFNEAGAVAGVVGAVAKVLAAEGFAAERFEVIVVDDGSSDGTAAAAEGAGARVLRHPTNMGYGKSLLTGFAAAKNDWILMIDADGTYPASDIPKLLAHAPGFDMVVGARQGTLFWGNPWETVRRRIYLMMAGFVAGQRIPDANSGLRLLRKSAVERSMPILCYGYSLSTTMTLSFLQAGRFVKFVPVSYEVRTGKSKVRLLRDVPRTLQIMTQVILHYNPLKFVVFLCLLPALFAAACAARFALTGDVKAFYWAGGAATAAVACFLLGCLMDSIRLGRRREGSPFDA